MRSLIKLPEPTLLFRHDQAMEDARDGLTLFGPLDEGKTYGIRAGVIGTREGIQRYKKWVQYIQGPIFNDPPHIARPPFPGFEAVFRIPWKPQPIFEIEVPDEELQNSVRIDDKHQRVFNTVEIYSNKIIEAISEEDVEVDIWFVIIPDDVYKYCRPRSYVETSLRIESKTKLPIKLAKNVQTQPLLFPQANLEAIPYQYEVNFHNQLKARLLEHKVTTQIIRESTIAHNDFLTSAL